MKVFLCGISKYVFNIYLLQTIFRTCVVLLLIGALSATLVPRCFQRCDECKDRLDDYDIQLCQSSCLRGKMDYQCSEFSTSPLKRSFDKRSLECKKYCYYCKVTYPQYNGNKCVDECKFSDGLKVDFNCINYW